VRNFLQPLNLINVFDTSFSEPEPNVGTFPHSHLFLDSHTLIEMDPPLGDALSCETSFPSDWSTPSMFTGLTLFVILFSFGLFFGGIGSSFLHKHNTLGNVAYPSFPGYEDNSATFNQFYRTSRTLKLNTHSFTGPEVINSSYPDTRPLSMRDVYMEESFLAGLNWHNISLELSAQLPEHY